SGPAAWRSEPARLGGTSRSWRGEKDGVRYDEQCRTRLFLEDSQALLEAFEARSRGEVSHRDHVSRATAVGEEEPQRVVEVERGGARTSEDAFEVSQRSDLNRSQESGLAVYLRLLRIAHEGGDGRRDSRDWTEVGRSHRHLAPGPKSTAASLTIRSRAPFRCSAAPRSHAAAASAPAAPAGQHSSPGRCRRRGTP